MRRSATGGIILAVAGQNANDKADLLAKCITNVVVKHENNVSVTRPRKSVNIIISGSNEFVSADEIVVAIAQNVGCKLEDIHL